MWTNILWYFLFCPEPIRSFKWSNNHRWLKMMPPKVLLRQFQVSVLTPRLEALRAISRAFWYSVFRLRTNISQHFSFFSTKNSFQRFFFVSKENRWRPIQWLVKYAKANKKSTWPIFPKISRQIEISVPVHLGCFFKVGSFRTQLN